MRLFNPEDPEFLVEVLHHISSDAPFRCTPPVPLDEKLSKRMRTLLNALATVITSMPGNPAAVAASITRESTAPLNLTIYFAFSFTSGQDIARSTEHLQSIYSLLRTIPPPIGDSSSGYSELTFSTLEDIVDRVHTFSSKLFIKRVYKRVQYLPAVRTAVEQSTTDEPPPFTVNEYEALEVLFEAILRMTKIAQSLERVSVLRKNDVQNLLTMHAKLSKHGILPKSLNDRAEYPLLDKLDSYLVEIGTKVKMRQWVCKMTSFVVASIRLVDISQSKRLNEIIHGNLNVQAMPHSSLPTEGYSCQLTFQALLATIDNALDVAPPTTRIDRRVASKFAQKLHHDHLTECGQEQVQRAKPSVHAEITLATWLRGEKLEVYPYIGVSKLSCGACHQYLRAINADMRFLTGETHGKYYYSWVCPPDTSIDVRNRLVKYLQEVLVKDLVRFANWQKFAERHPDSSVSSGGDIGVDALERRYVERAFDEN